MNSITKKEIKAYAKFMYGEAGYRHVAKENGWFNPSKGHCRFISDEEVAADAKAMHELVLDGAFKKPCWMK